MNLLINTNNYTISFVILFSLIFYYIYFYFTSSVKLQKFCTDINPQDRISLLPFVTKKLSGFIILGLVPGVLYYFFLDPNFEKFGLSMADIRNNLIVILPLILIIAFLLFIRQKANN